MSEERKKGGLVRWAARALSEAPIDQALARRAKRLLDRLDGVTSTLQRVADLELRVVERLVPIVEDLGELVRHSLDEVRERRGLPPRGQRPQ